MIDGEFLSGTAQMISGACNMAGICDRHRLLLTSITRRLAVEYPVKMDDGTTVMIKGYRFQHCDARGPYKGGIRIAVNISEAEVAALSMLMSLKSAVLGLPYGGAKGGIVADKEKLSCAELEQVCRGYIRAIFPVIGPDTDIPAPDMNVSPEAMGWMMDEYERMTGRHVPQIVTGKPLVLGGSRGRVSAVAWGGVFLMEEIERRAKNHFRSYAIQGFGNVGGNLAKILAERNKPIVAVSDSKGGTYNENGLNISALARHKEKTGTVVGFNGGKDITNQDLLELDVDVLVPAARENQISERNADKINAKILLCLANGPINRQGSELLGIRDILVIPDILANGGGVVVSYLEWAQCRQGFAWRGSEVTQRLKDLMRFAYKNVSETSREYGKDLYNAAYILGVKNIVAAMKARSI
ncbi:Glu/Leu/Phe/Val family dehydrogenase [Methanocella sp. MCL-LM]|uniref:Glu/Leu/Phe/Val family dehydrogenase n=1 Tax=Methanocella sp. MCL-LM TaxID=3412035 RepID=UPI003C72E450